MGGGGGGGGGGGRGAEAMECLTMENPTAASLQQFQLLAFYVYIFIF